MSTFPATNSNEAVELIIDGGNQLHQIINEDATTEVQTESGPIPSVRKALADTFLFLEPIAWQNGSDEIAFNQLRTFDDNIYWAPTASLSNPIPMGATPIGDSNWKLAPVKMNETSILTAIGKVSVGFWDEDPEINNDNEFVVDRLSGYTYTPRNLPYIVNSNTNPDPSILVSSGILYRTSNLSSENFVVDNCINNLPSVSSMLSETTFIGRKYSTGGTIWEHTSGQGNDISNFTPKNDVYVRDLGVESGVDASSIITNYAEKLFNNGARTLVLNVPVFRINTNTDFKGLNLVGHKTIKSGDGWLNNYGEIKGVILEEYDPSIKKVYPEELSSNGPKFIYRQNQDRYFVATPRSDHRKGGALFEVEQDTNASPSNSLGGPAELLRTTLVHKCTGLYSWNSNYSSSQGTWEDWSVPSSYLQHGADNEYRGVVSKRNSTTTSGDFLEWDVEGGLGRECTLALAGTPASAQCNLIVNGNVIENLNPSEWDGSINIIKFQLKPSQNTVRVQTTNTGYVYIVGVDFSEINDMHSVTGDINNWAAYRDSRLTHYITDRGAHDYAIFDADANLWGGSYHGGEVRLLAYAVVDGETQQFPIYSDGAIKAFHQFEIKQQTQIDWTGSGGGVINTNSTTTFNSSQVQIQCVMTSPTGINVDKLYTAMVGAKTEFDNVAFPAARTISPNERLYLGQSSKLQLQHTLSNSTITVDTNVYEDWKGTFGQAELNHVDNVYVKLYYGPVQRSITNIQSVPFRSVKTFN